MSRKRHKPEEIVAKLRQVDVLTAQGTPVADAVRSIGVTEVASGRVAGWGDLLLTPRGADRHRELATSLQHGPPACFSGLPATGPGGVRASLRRMAGCATPTGSAGHAPGGAQTDHELTFKPDHPRGADQGTVEPPDQLAGRLQGLSLRARSRYQRVNQTLGMQSDPPPQYCRHG